MKKLIIFSACLFQISMVLSQSMNLGVKLGYNSSNISTDFQIVKESKKAVSGLHAGIVLDIPLSDLLSLQPQIVYGKKGVYFKPSHSHAVDVRSLDLPILLNFRTKSGVFAGIGPNLGYNISAKNTATFPDKVEVKKYKFTDDPYEYKRWDLGLMASLGYIHSSGLFASVNYLKGLNKVSNLPDNTWSSNTLSFSLGYLIQKKESVEKIN